MRSVSVHDVAAYVLKQFDQPISTMKLQKLVYLSQGWHLGLLGKPLFAEELEAWARGPVSRDLFRHHRTEYAVSTWSAGNAANLSANERVVVDAVIKNYGALSGLELSELTHLQGTPWQRTRARSGLPDGAASSQVIPKTEIQDHFEAVFAATS